MFASATPEDTFPDIGVFECCLDEDCDNKGLSATVGASAERFCDVYVNVCATRTVPVL